MTMEERIKELHEAANKFHTHLDECKRCEQRPFDLCPVGHKLLNAAAGVGTEKKKEAA